jgi:hypothetical protein
MPASRGATRRQSKSIVLKVEFIFAKKSLLPFAMTTTQSFSTDIFDPTDARLATTAKTMI